MAPDLATALLSLVFAAGPYTVRLTIDFPPAWQGTPLDLYNDSRPLALPPGSPFGSRIEHFVGAVALVRYQITDAAGRPRKHGTIRERVLLLEQSPSLPDRPPFEHTVKVVRGVASDCQLFGYDETNLPAADRPAERLQSRGFFRRFRQELYLDDAPSPFAILEWRHATDAIRLTDYAARN
jgi:hypothetical protein